MARALVRAAPRLFPAALTRRQHSVAQLVIRASPHRADAGVSRGQDDDNEEEKPDEQRVLDQILSAFVFQKPPDPVHRSVIGRSPLF